MPIRSQASVRAFTVTVDFLSGDERYASETYAIEAASVRDAERRALELAQDSYYDDPRIPDLRRKVGDVVAEDDHPDDEDETTSLAANSRFQARENLVKTDRPERDLVLLLARARRAIEAPDQLTQGDRWTLLETLASTEAHIAGSDLPWSIDIHIGSIDHRHGLNQYAASTRAALIAEVAIYCRENWSRIGDGRDPATLDDETVTCLYFDGREEEHLLTDRIRVGPSAQACVPQLLETGWYCVLGTAHLSTSTADLLDRWCSDQVQDRPLNIASSIYGWFVPTREVDPITRAEIPDDLLAALCFGRERGFDHVLFDCDAGTVEGLRVHDW